MRNFKFLISLVAVSLLTTFSAHAEWSGEGTGTIDDPYLIGTAAQLNEFATGINNSTLAVTSCAKLTADIDYSAYQTRIGVRSGNATTVDPTVTIGYTGTFDGDYHTITLALTATQNFCALFECTNGNAVIKNLHTTGTVNMGATYVRGAGVVAYADNINSGAALQLINVTSDVEITGTATTYSNAGLIATNHRAVVLTNCAFFGSFKGAATPCYGLVGKTNAGSAQSATLTNCYVKATLETITSSVQFAPTVAAASSNYYYNASSTFATKQGTVCEDADFANQKLAALLNEGVCNGTWKQGTTNPVIIGGEAVSDYCFDMDNDTILIETANNLEVFASMVNMGKYLTNYVKVMDNIDYSAKTTMIGNSTKNIFAGTFDGNGHTITLGFTAGAQYCALFQYAGGLTVKDLHLTGAVNMGDYTYGASLIANKYSGVGTITNVSSDVVITGTKAQQAFLSGLVAYNTAGNLTFTNCAFYGQILGPSKYSAGILGKADAGTLTINNSYVAAKIETATSSKVFNIGNATLNNCYYPDTITRITLQGMAEPVASFQTGGVVAFLLNQGACDGTWKQTATRPELFAGEAVPCLKDSDDYYNIYNAYDWYRFAMLVNKCGQTTISARLMADIDLGASDYKNTMLGTSTSNLFAGKIDGNYHTMTLNYNELGVDYVALIQYAGGVEVKNLNLAGSIAMGANKYGASLIAYHKSDAATLTSVTSSVTINGTAAGAYFGGLVSYNYNGALTINACGFNGKFTGTSTYSAGILGTRYSGTVTISNSYVAATIETPTSSNVFNLGTSTINNCYYHQDACANYATKQGVGAPAELFKNGLMTQTLNSGAGAKVWHQNVKQTPIDTVPVIFPNRADDYEFENGIKIYTVADWEKFAMYVNAGIRTMSAELMNDLDLTCKHTHVGKTTATSFCGTFNGNYHTITIRDTSTCQFDGGLFSYVASNAATDTAYIKNLHLAGTIYANHTEVGALMGRVYKGHAFLSSVLSTVIVYVGANKEHASGFLGSISGGNIQFDYCGFAGKFLGVGANCTPFTGTSGNSKTICNNCYAASYSQGTSSSDTFIHTSGSYQLSNNYYLNKYSNTPASGVAQKDSMSFVNGTVTDLLNGDSARDGKWYQCPEDTIPMIKMTTCQESFIPCKPFNKEPNVQPSDSCLAVSWVAVKKVIGGATVKEGSLTYVLDVATDSLFTNLLMDSVAVDPIQLDDTLSTTLCDQKYPECYVRLRALNQYGISEYSDTAMARATEDGLEYIYDNKGPQQPEQDMINLTVKKLQSWMTAGEFDLVVNRTFAAGINNTFCLPFATTPAQIATAFGCEVDVYHFDGATVSGTEGNYVLNFNLTPFTTDQSIPVGEPFLVNPAEAVANPVFYGVTISYADSLGLILQEGEDVEYLGLITPRDVAQIFKSSKKYMGVLPSGTLAWADASKSTGYMRGFRGIFHVNKADTQDTPIRTGMPARFVINEPTDIISVSEQSFAPAKMIENGQVVILVNGVKYNVLGGRL